MIVIDQGGEWLWQKVQNIPNSLKRMQYSIAWIIRICHFAKLRRISIYFNYIGKFENEVTQLAEPTEQEIRQMREEIEEAKKEKSRAYHRQYSREYRARNLEKQREYDRMKAREYRARRKAQAAAAQPTQ